MLTPPPMKPGQYDMRVLMAGPLPPAVGGMATVLGDLAQSSLQEKVELVMFDTFKQTPEGRSLLQAVQTRFKLWAAWWSLLIIRPNTIAHIHTCSGLTFFLDCGLVFLAKVNGVPVVLHIHGARFDEFWDSLSGIKRALGKLFVSMANFVVVLSPEWQTKLSKRIPSARFRVVANGVAMPPSLQLGRKPDEVTILFLGNLSKRKGIQELIQAVSLIHDAFHLVVAGGEDDPGMTAAVRQQIKELGLSDKVQLLGAIGGETKQYWLNVADIFVLPSYAEGVPISMLEAMAAGVPVVVTPVGGIPSVIQHEHNGVFVNPGDIEQLAETLHALIEDPELRQTIGAQGQRDCLARYGVEHTVDAYLSLYRELRR